MFMLCEKGRIEDLPKLKGYITELKYDGCRAFIHYKKGKGIHIYNRNGNNITKKFPEFERIRTPRYIKELLIDGEIISDDFNHLQSRIHTDKAIKIRLLSKCYPCKFVAFDIVLVNGINVGKKDILIERKRYLENYLLENDWLKKIKTYDNPKELWDKVIEKDLEGIIMKAKHSLYYPKRSKFWLKIKNNKFIDCKILDYEKNDGYGCLITDKGKVNLANRQNQLFYLTHKPKEVVVECRELSKNGKMRFAKLIKFKI